MSSTLTTHVLDTALGVPASGIAVRLYACDGAARTLLAERTTNADGRTDEPLGTTLEPGTYEIAFAVGPYFTRDARPAFYDEIAVRFTLEPSRAHHHVPLLLAPFGYSTYRGS
jgi:5-hydroxyisourate hydrolase